MWQERPILIHTHNSWTHMPHPKWELFWLKWKQGLRGVGGHHFPCPPFTPVPEPPRHTCGCSGPHGIIVWRTTPLHISFSLYASTIAFIDYFVISVHIISRKKAHNTNSSHILSTYYVLACLLSALWPLLNLIQPLKVIVLSYFAENKVGIILQNLLRPTPERWQNQIQIQLWLKACVCHKAATWMRWIISWCMSLSTRLAHSRHFKKMHCLRFFWLMDTF